MNKNVVYSVIPRSYHQDQASHLQMILSHFERSDQHIRLATLRIARPPLIDIVGIIRSDDVFTCLRVIHCRVSVRKEAIQKPVNKTSRDEGVDISNSKPRRSQQC